MIRIMALLLLLVGCTSSYTYIKADRFNGDVPGFGRIDAQGIEIRQAPGRANSAQEIYEVSERFWEQGDK